MNISLAPEQIFTIAGVPITNSILTGWVVTALLLILALIFRRGLKRIPGRLQAFLDLIYTFFYDMAVQIIGREDVVRELFPYLITLFFFIVIGSWVGLLPGITSFGFPEIKNGTTEIIPLFRAPTTDLNTTVALACVSMAYIEYLGIKYAGAKSFFKKFFNFSNPIGFAVGIFELISELGRIISFSFRLFGNIFAGDVLIGVMIFLTVSLLPYIAPLPLPFFILETFVDIVQAYVFCFLTIIFTSLAIVSHDQKGHQHGGEELLLSEKAAQAETRLELGNKPLI
ncbi:F0F1 ATP synthase subunit A [Patescibacteria group bacterium]|nr:F0F1 ATP synthase subunit A [Patescibacteria group bacterium]